MNALRIEAGEASAPDLCLRQLAKDVNVRLSDPLGSDESAPAPPAHMFSVASSQRLAVAITSSGITVYDLKILRDTFYNADRNTTPTAPSVCTLTPDSGTGDVRFVTFADNDAYLVAATSRGHVMVWETTSLRLSPSAPRTIAPPRNDTHVHMLIPNPGDKSSLCVLVYGTDPASHANGSAHILDVAQSKWMNTLPSSNVTAVSWSTRGKQLVLGLQTGEILQVTPEGEVKASLPPPPESDRPLYVEDVQWLENHVFLVTYNTCATEAEPVHEYDLFVVLRDSKANSITYAAFPLDVSPPFGDTNRWGCRYTSMLRDWAPMKHIVFMACSASTDVGAIGYKNSWEALELEETSRPVLPFLTHDDSSDSAPIALGMDLTATEPVPDPKAAEKGEDVSSKLPPVPILYVYTNDGVLLAYHVIYTEADKPYPGMVTQIGAQSQSLPQPTPPPAQQPAPLPPAFGAPAFKSTSAFESSTKPSFGSTSAFGSTAKPAFGSTSAFGQPNTFGIASNTGGGFSSFGGSGATAFGSSASQNQTSAFGQTHQPSFGSASAFGQTQKLGSNTSPSFGSTTGFGPSHATAFGQFSQKHGASGFGSSAFGSMANKSTGFGLKQPSQDSVFGSGGSFDTGKPAFSSVAPAPKPSPQKNELDEKDAPETSAFSFGGFGDSLSHSNTKSAFGVNPKPTGFSFGQSTQPGSSVENMPQASTATSKEKNNSFDATMISEQQMSALTDTTQNETHSTKQNTQTQKESNLENKPAGLYAVSQPKLEHSSEDKSEKGGTPVESGAMSQNVSSFAKPFNDEPKKSGFLFADPEEKPQNNFSYSKPSDEQRNGNVGSFAEAENKKNGFAFSESKNKSKEGGVTAKLSENKEEDNLSSTKPEDKKDGVFLSETQLGNKSKDAASAEQAQEKPLDAHVKSSEVKPQHGSLSFANSFESEKKTIFSSAKPAEDKKETGFSFAKPTEDKKGTGFSFAKPAEDKKETGFSFAKPTEDRKESGFSFAKPTEDKKGTGFSFAKPAEDKKGTGFSFAKPAEDKKETGFSFAKPAEDKKETGFSFAKPTEDKKDTGFSFAKPAEDKKETGFSLAEAGNQKSKLSDDVKEDTLPPQKSQSFSFAKDNVEKKIEMPAFSFTKSETKPTESESLNSDLDTSKSAVSLSAKPAEEQRKSSAFSFAKSEVKPASSAFSSFVPKQQESDSSKIPSAIPSVPTDKLKPLSLSEAVPQIDLSNVPEPSTIKEENELKQEFSKIYAQFDEELLTLRRQTKQCADFFVRLKEPSAASKGIADLSDMDAWTFGDMKYLPDLTKKISEQVYMTESQYAETQKRIAAVESVQLKTEVKREEVARFLRARQDPNFAKRVRVRHLGPEQVENQARLRRSSHLVRERMNELSEYFGSLQKSIVNAKHGRSTMRAPTLDTIYRSADHIDKLVTRRIQELDKMELDVKATLPLSSVRARTPRSPSRPLSDMAELEAVLPQVGDDCSVAQVAVTQSVCNALWKSKQGPVVTKVSEASCDASAFPYQMTPVVLQCKQVPMPPKAVMEKPELNSAAFEAITKQERPSINFLATTTPKGVQAPSKPKLPAFNRSTLPTLPSKPDHTSALQYTTFEGLVRPKPVQKSEQGDLTLEEFVAQGHGDDESDDDEDGYSDDSYADYDESDDDEQDDDEVDDSEDEDEDEDEDDNDDGTQDGNDDATP